MFLPLELGCLSLLPLDPNISSVHGFFFEEEKQEYIQIEDSAPEGVIISNQAPEEETSTMVVVKWSDKVEGSGDDIDSPLCGGLYKEETYIVPWSGKDPDAKMNGFSWSKVNNDWIVPEDQYDDELKNWRGPIHNGKFLHNTISL